MAEDFDLLSPELLGSASIARLTPEQRKRYIDGIEYKAKVCGLSRPFFASCRIVRRNCGSARVYGPGNDRNCHRKSARTSQPMYPVLVCSPLCRSHISDTRKRNNACGFTYQPLESRCSISRTEQFRTHIP